MPSLVTFDYDREKAVAYAHEWAYARNPEYYDFNDIGGNCTNFVSQCIYAGAGVMNYTPTFGWYYIDANDRSPSWTGVTFLYDFLVSNDYTGPFGSLVTADRIEPGDVCQLNISKDTFHHSVIVVSVENGEIRVASHTRDVDCRPLYTYGAREIRYIHIDGVRSTVV